MSNKNNDDLQRQASENTLGLNPVIGIRRKDCWLGSNGAAQAIANRCTAPSTSPTSAWN
jgi:hypothetical protein